MVFVMFSTMFIQSFKTNYEEKNIVFDKSKCTEAMTYEQYENYYNSYHEIIDKDESERTNHDIETLEREDFENTRECFCIQYDLMKIYNDEKLYKFCKYKVFVYINSYVITLVGSIILLILNNVLASIISKITLWIPFKSLTSQLTIQIIYVTLALFINSFVSFFN